jgi:uncharacterized membrane protein
MTKPTESLPHLPLERALFVMGIACSMFFDGIVLHQLLQWHHLGSNLRAPDTVRNLQWNTLLNGLFHGAAWIVAIWGVWLLSCAARSDANSSAGRVPRALTIGAFVAGWGSFNIVENIINHFILQAHHVREGTPYTMLYDIGFLAALGFVPALLGVYLLHQGRAQTFTSSRATAP